MLLWIVLEVRYAGDVGLSDTELDLLAEDEHAFEKVVRAMTKGRSYWYALILQSWGPNYGHEEPPSKLWSDASGPLHFYVRNSTWRDDLWDFYHITDNHRDPTYGSQSYTINTWHLAPIREWTYKGPANHSGRHLYQGWALPQQIPAILKPAQDASAPPAPIEPRSAPGPIVMGMVVTDNEAPYEEPEVTPRPMRCCCPFGGSK